MRLSESEIANRLSKVDYRLTMDMRCSIMDVAAYHSKDEASRGVNAITRESDSTDAWFYRVTYRIKTLVAENRYSEPERDPVIILVDLNAHGDYPFSRPESYVIGSTVPWSPHFARGVPVCFELPGRVWAATGKTTLAHLLLHFARLINFDEVIADPNYVGYNPEAVAFWRTALRSRSIVPELSYPVLPAWFFGANAPAMNAKGAVKAALSGSPVASGARATVKTGPAPKASVVRQQG